MIIVDPITLGDTSFSRPSVKNVYNGNGTLVEVPANTLGVTYDPADLSKAPWALLEPEATNRTRNSTMQGAAAGFPGALPTTWEDAIIGGLSRQIIGVTKEAGIDCIDLRIFGAISGAASPEYTVLFGSGTATAAAAGEKWVSSVFVRISAGTLNGITAAEHFVLGFNNLGGLSEARSKYFTPSQGPLNENRNVFEHTIAAASTVSIVNRIDLNFGAVGAAVDVTLRIGLPQFERDRLSSPIKTSNGAVTRAADVVGSAAGLLYSNVPITEPDYSAAATYAKDALVHDPVTHNVFKSLIDANKGKALTDPAAWNPRGATNRWAMLDQYNNTQTIYPEEIIIVLTPQAISEGLYIGNCEADEIELSVVDQSEGLVASEVTSLVTASGTSSYFDWCFRPADRSDYFVTTSLPPYANALVLIAIRKPGGVPKCGMLAIGGVDDFGPSLYGLSAEGKDYSSTTFNFDGTTNTELRPYAKKMSVDVQVDNSEIDYIQRKLFQIRQRPIVWIGGPYGATAVFGRYGSFKIVIPGLKKSDMALQIEGSV
jgi:hypothetical protein